MNDNLYAENPYSSPQSALGIDASIVEVGEYQVDGRDLMLRNGKKLPSFCIKSNEPITESDFRTKTLSWCPRWVLVLIVLNVLIMLVAYFITCKKCLLTFGLSPEVRRKYRNRLIAKSAIAIALLCVTVIAASLNYQSMAIVTGILFAVALVVALLGNAPLSIVKHQKGTFWIRGCSDEFLNRLDRRQGNSPQLAPQ